jgi:hypothetical protein
MNYAALTQCEGLRPSAPQAPSSSVAGACGPLSGRAEGSRLVESLEAAARLEGRRHPTGRNVSDSEGLGDRNACGSCSALRLAHLQSARTCIKLITRTGKMHGCLDKLSWRADSHGGFRPRAGSQNSFPPPLLKWGRRSSLPPFFSTRGLPARWPTV